MILDAKTMIGTDRLVVSDGVRKMSVQLLGSAIASSASLRFPCLIRVEEYVFSRDKSGSEPFVGIATLSPLSSSALILSSINFSNAIVPYQISASPQKQRGLSPQFFRAILPSMSLREIVGKPSQELLDKIGKFILRHESVKVLTELQSSGNAVPNVQHYQSSLDTFLKMKHEKEVDGLNERMKLHEDSPKLLRLGDHSKLSWKNPITAEDILELHKTEFETFSWQPRPGCWRTREINIPGHACVFSPPERVAEDMKTVCDSLATLWNQPNEPDALRSMILATCLCFATLDIHPFSYPENSVMARLCIDRVLGFPFRLPVYSFTSDDDEAFCKAVAQCRSNIILIAHTSTSSSQELIRMAAVAAGALEPLFTFLLNFVCKEIDRFEEVLKADQKEETSSPTPMDMDQLSRDLREQSLSESCLICLEDGPNISTLCCGKPLHFNCMSKWLSRNSTCPQCRFDLPRPLRLAVAAPPPTGNRGGSVDQHVARVQNTMNDVARLQNTMNAHVRAQLALGEISGATRPTGRR